MSDYLRITGGLVEHVEERILRTVPLESLTENLVRETPVTLPTIGRTQVFAHFDPTDPNAKRLFVLTEIEPGVKALVKQIRGRNDRARRYRLSMPWTYFWFVATQTNGSDIWGITDYKAYHARDRYNGPNSRMIPARLPNVYEDGRICWGSAGVDPSLPLSERIDSLTNGWYLSRFNDDLGLNLPMDYPSYREWVAATRANPLSYQNWADWNSERNISVADRLATYQVDNFTQRIVAPEAIPLIPMGATFGRMEEWWRTEFTPIQRVRARIALNNLGDLDAEVEVPEEVDPTDDGGEEIAI